jgi:hypothetical protein
LLLTDVTDSDAGFYSVRVSNSGGSVTSQAAQLIVSQTPPPPTSVLRSTSITLSRAAGVKGVITVKDENGGAIPDATVYTTWTLPDGTTQSQTGTTASDGTGRFTIKAGRGTYTLTVNDIVKAGYSFDGANSVLTKSITR